MRLVLVFALASLAVAQEPSSSCEMPDGLAARLEQMPGELAASAPWSARIAVLRKLTEDFPQSVTAHLRYQNAFLGRRQFWEEYDRAFAIYRAKPKDTLFRFLDARLTASYDGKRGEEQLRQLLADQPNFPWTHLALIEAMRHTGARDSSAVGTHYKAFTSACPDAREGLLIALYVDDPELLREAAARWRPLIAEPRFARDWRLWGALWNIELKVAAPADRPASQKQIEADAKRLLEIPPGLDQAFDWYRAIRQGQMLTNSTDLNEGLRRVVTERFAGSELAVSVEREELMKDPARKPEMFTEVIIRKFPNSPILQWEYATRLVHRATEAAPLEPFDKLRQVDLDFPDFVFSNPPVPIQLAQMYVRTNRRLDQVLPLLDEGMRRIEGEQRYLFKGAPVPVNSQMESLARSTADIVRADYYLATGDLDSAATAITKGIALLPVDSPRRHDWYFREGRLAALQGKAPIALAHYQRFASRHGTRFSAVPSVEAVEVRRYYLLQGGTADTIDEWASLGSFEPVRSAPHEHANPLTAAAAVGEFSAKDLTGKVWTLADLKGKATFVDLWATWCAPCRAEHPGLQKLYDSLKQRTDIQVLTFSVDEHPFLAESYMKESKLSFPVIADPKLTLKLFPMGGLPSSYIVYPDGRRSLNFRFSDPARVLAELEKATKMK